MAQQGIRFTVGQELFLENWLGGTFTAVRIVELPADGDARVTRPGFAERELVPLEGLTATPDPRLTQAADYGAH